MKRYIQAIVLVALLVLIPAQSWSEDNDPADREVSAEAKVNGEVKPEEAPLPQAAEFKWRWFEASVFLQTGLPGTFDPEFADKPKSGLGFGYGFTLGVRPMPYFTIAAYLDALFHNQSYDTLSENDFASVGGLGLTAKIFPMGDRHPRIYGFIGYGMVNFWVHDSFTLLPESGTGATYRGSKLSFGVGYEHFIEEQISLDFSAELGKVSLTKRTFAKSDPVDLSPSRSRTAVLLKGAFLARF